MSQILQFPKDKMKRAQRQQKSEGQRVFLMISLFSFILIAVLSNEQVMRKERTFYLISDNSARSIEQVNRAIASAQPVNLFRDVEWEHQLAKKLGSAERSPSSLPQQVSLMDHLRFGTLAGKYRITAEAQKIREVEYIDSLEIADRPVQIPDHREFLMEYRKLLPMEYSRVSLAEKNAGTETWSLVSDSGQTVGSAVLRFDDGGHFLGFQVKPGERVSAE